MPLTDTGVRQAKPADKTYKVSDEKGLYLEVTPIGGKRWRLKYRFGGKEKRISLGTYPDTKLKGARKKRNEARDLLDEGIDPSAHKQAEKAAQTVAAATTFEAVAREWYETKHTQEVTESHAHRNLRRLERLAFPALGRRPIAKITAPEVLQVLRRVADQGHTETAHRVKALTGQVMRYAIATGRAERDVTADLRDALAPANTKRTVIANPSTLRMED